MEELKKNNDQREISKLEHLPAEFFVYYLFPYINQNEIRSIFFNLNNFFHQNVLTYFSLKKTIDLSDQSLLNYFPHLSSSIETIHIEDKNFNQIFPTLTSSYPKLQSLFISNVVYLPHAKFLKYLQPLKQLKSLNISENKTKYVLLDHAYIEFSNFATLFEEDSLLESFNLVRTWPLSYNYPTLKTINYHLQKLSIHLLHLRDLTNLLKYLSSLKYIYAKITHGTNTYQNDYQSNFVLLNLIQCHLECKQMAYNHLKFFLEQLKQSTFLQLLKLHIDDLDEKMTENEIREILPNLRKFFFYIRFPAPDTEPHLIEQLFSSSKFMRFNDCRPYYYSFLSLPYTFKRLSNISNNIIYSHLTDKNKEILFSNVEHIVISDTKNQLSPKLIKFINEQFPNLYTVQIKMNELHKNLINDRTSKLNNVKKLILDHVFKSNYKCFKRLLLLTPNIETLIIDYGIICAHRHKLKYDKELLPIRRRIQTLRVLESIDGIPDNVFYDIRNRIFTNLKDLTDG